MSDDELYQEATQSWDQNLEQWKHIYLASLAVNNAVKVAPKFDPTWPPTASDMSEEKINEIVPTELFNLLVWITGFSDQFEQYSFVSVAHDIRLKILSIAQDILSLSNYGHTPPKHYMLGMAVRHIIGSQRLLDLLHGLGHCASPTTVRRLDTDIATAEIYKDLPSTLHKNIFTTLVFDNIDFMEETVSGQNTTHCVNGIAIQNLSREEFPGTPGTETAALKKSRNTKLKPAERQIMPYPKGHRSEPEAFQSTAYHDSENEARKSSTFKDNLYFLLKSLSSVSEDVRPLPSWTGFNSFVQTEIPLVSTLTYLPVIDGNTTALSTVNTILHRSLEIADKLELKQVVIVADQAIYAKAQQIRWGNDVFKKRLVLRLGEFHTVMAFMGALGKRFKNSGLEEILLESGVVAGGSMNSVISGHHYNRAVRAHKLLAEALERLQWEAFLQEQSPEDQDIIRTVIQTVLVDLPNSFRIALDDPRIMQIVKSFEQYNEEHSNCSATYMFWSSYLEMVHVMLRFLRATREGNWDLHLSAVHDMLPWLFALDRVNYARYLTVYYHEMLNLQPEIVHEFKAGKFSVQRQSTHSFSKVACDQAIEQTVNRDAKSKSGWTGFSVNKGAVFRWIMSSHVRGTITRQCELMAGQSSEEKKMKKELELAFMSSTEEMVASLQECITSHINPFTVNAEGIINISSGAVSSETVTCDQRRAHEIGKNTYDQFVQQRIINKQKSVYEPIQAAKLENFSCLSSLVKVGL